MPLPEVVGRFCQIIDFIAIGQLSRKLEVARSGGAKRTESRDVKKRRQPRKKRLRPLEQVITSEINRAIR
jgi:hypothetical protein